MGTYDGNNEKIYIDGQSSNFSTFSEDIKVSDSPFYIGNGMGDVDYTMTTVSDALIYNRALTDTEIYQDFTDKINPTNQKKLLLWYKFA